MESASSTASPTGARAPYGRACTNCSRVKCRCIYQPGETICERCQRLRKDCVSSVPIRKRTIKKSRTTQLEEKFDGLVSLLHSQAAVSYPQQPETSSPVSALSIRPMQVGGIPTPHSNIGTSPSTPSVAEDVAIHTIPDAVADDYLNTFRSTFLPFFPFVHIPVAISASDLRLQKPFLWLVIMALTTKSAAQRLAMDGSIRQIISRNVVAEHEKSLDILLGLICYLAWFHYFKKDKPYLVMWTQLAVALLFELGILRASSQEWSQFSSKVDWFPFRTPGGPTKSLEERRAALAVFMISSMVWTGLRQAESLRWTPYMDDCVNVLRREHETDLDFLLTLQARCYVASNQMTHPPTEWTTDGEGSRPRAPYMIRVLQQQLQDLRQSLPAEMHSHRSALLSLYGTDIIGKEALLHRPRTRDQADLRRLEELESLLVAIERWFELYHQIPLTDWIAVPFAVFSQSSHCIKLLFRLTTLDEPGWDTEEVRRRADLLDFLDRTAQVMERLPEAVGMVNDVEPGEGDLWLRGAPLIRGLRAKFAAEMMPPTLQTFAEDPGLVELPDDFATYFSNDPWLIDMFT